MKRINIKQSQKKNMIIVATVGTLLGGLFLASPLYLPDDTPVKDTWRTSVYSSMGHSIKVSDVTTVKETGETFFTLINDGKPFNGETIKLSLHAIQSDGTLVGIQDISQFTLESDEKENLKATGYSFFWPSTTYHLQVTITSLDSDNHLLNQQVIYLDKRKANSNDESFTMNDYVTQQMALYLKPTIETSSNQVKDPIAIKDDTTSSGEVTGDDIQTPNEEKQNPTGTLQQSYVIEFTEQIQSNHEHTDLESESDQPQYTLSDLEHQLTKAQEELKSNPNDEALQQQISNLKKEIESQKASE